MDHTSAILERLTELHPRAIDLTLGRLGHLLARMGHPERSLPPVIHIAGTNGKGSTTAYMRAILEAAGRSVHVYTSPHLVRFHERIRLGRADGPGQLVEDAALTKAMLEVERLNDGAEITQFEITTAIALKLFAENPADVLLLEVGLGGRLDATNVIETPLVSVITPISMDHESFLGDTLGAIAAEKAGVLKRGAPAVIARQMPAAEAVIADRAQDLSVSTHWMGQDFDAFEEHGRMVYQTATEMRDLPRPNLPGAHQIANAGLAIAALKVANLLPAAAAVEQGLTQAIWPARLQRLTSGALVQSLKNTPLAEAELWLDGGHNPGAGQAVAAAMAALEERVERPLFLIAGMLNTKDPIGFFEPFEGLARHVFTVAIPGAEASRSAVDLAGFAHDAGLSAEPADSVPHVLSLLADHWQYERSPRILMCGSLYLAGEVLKLNQTLPD